MSENKKKAHWSFWLFCILAIIWNLLGSINFIAQLDTNVVAQLPESHKAIIEGRPIWALLAFALSVFGGLIGCILLVLRKAIAFPFLVASLVGTIIQVIPHVGIVGSGLFETHELVMMIVMPFVFSGFLVWYAWSLKKNQFLV